MPRQTINVLLSIWRGENNVAACSVTDEKFLAELKRWAERHDYKCTQRDKEFGPEHK